MGPARRLLRCVRRDEGRRSQKMLGKLLAQSVESQNAEPGRWATTQNLIAIRYLVLTYLLLAIFWI